MDNNQPPEAQTEKKEGDKDEALHKLALKRFDRALEYDRHNRCLLYTSPSPRDQRGSRMPSSA